MIPWRSVLLAAAILCAPSLAHAQAARVLSGGCGSIDLTGLDTYPITMDTTGKQCTGGAGSGGTPSSPASITINALDVAVVTTGGSAVTAITAGKRAKGGWIMNPSTATVDLCINEVGTASGTTSSGSTTCIAPGRNYNLAPSASAVSVIASDNTHAFSGYGFQ